LILQRKFLLIGAAAAVCAAVLASAAVGEGPGNPCASQCFAQEKACMRATKGGPSCDAALTRCLQACRARR
jgi:hypothetical protein